MTQFAEDVLEGEHVRLERLTTAHQRGLADAIRDGELWKLYVTLVPHPDQMASFFERAEKEFAAGEGAAFATIDRKTNRIAGSTRFLRANWAHRRVEIGYTFLGVSWQRTALNTEAKLLMLGHAFESLGMNRVDFVTDYLNHSSRQSILRLGAKEEGILRNHMVMPDGRIRDSVVYSIIANEWPGIRRHLEHKLA